MSGENKGIYKRGKYYWMCYTYCGKQFCRTTKKKTEAEALIYRRDFINNLAKQTVNQHQVIFDEMAVRFLEEKERKCRAKTYNMYVYLLDKLNSYFTNQDLMNISKTSIKDYENYRLLNGCSNGLLRKELALLKNMFNYAIEYDLVANSPFDHYNFAKVYQDYKPRLRFLQPLECQRLINIANPYLRRLLIVLLETGMRIKEALSLCFSNIAFEEKANIPYIHLLAEYTKSNKDRFIPLSKLAMEQINLQKKEFPASLYIFTDSRGNYYKTTPKSALNNTLKKAGLTKASFHTLRHTAGSFWLQGIDYLGNPRKPLRIEVVSEILGHADIAITKKIYAQFDNSRLFIEFLNK